jgi:hypothetical protein
MWRLMFRAFHKYLLSFTKSDWGLEDYPVTFVQQESNVSILGLGEPLPWSAQIINWWLMVGMGDTKEAALRNLTRNFNDYKRQHASLPRPGTPVLLQFASFYEISLYDSLACDFFQKILERNYDDVFISDESSLWDFLFPEDYADVIELIKQTYQVDVSDIRTGSFVEIFRRIYQSSPNFTPPD